MTTAKSSKRTTKKTEESMPAASTTPAATKTSRKRKTEPTPPPVELPPSEAPAPKTAAKRQKKKAASEVSSVAPSSVAPSSVAPPSEVSGVTVVKKTRKTKEKKKRNTRTPSSYVLFSMNHRKTVIEKNPDLTLGEVSKLCGSAWKGLSSDDRAPWMKQATELKEKRQAEIAEEMKNEPPKKKRTPSSYLLFAMEHRKVVLESDPSMAIGAVSKICGARWKEMNEADRKTWKDKADALKTTTA